MSASLKNKFAFSTAIVVAAAFSAPALASGQSLPDFMMTWFTTADDTGPVHYDPAQFGKANAIGNGTYQYVGGLSGTEWSFGWDCLVRPNTPGFMGGGGSFVDAAIVVTNNSASTETFSVLMSLGTTVPGPTTINGNVAATVVANAFGLNATLSAPSGGSVYAGFIDLNDPNVDLPAATLFDDSYSLTATGFTPEDDADGFSGLPGAEVNSNIALLLTFTLTAGATATVSGFFQVIPAPAALAIFGLLGVTSGRRRRNA
jgi:hypothetical protein